MVDPDVMADVIESGVWDLIGAARPSIADPFLPLKIEQGRYDEIRACIGCNACYARANRGGHLGCTQNATAGEEHRRGWHPERFERAANADREVLVVGAGPSGLECAIVLAKRGFERVRLVDAADEIGGCMRWIPQLPGLDAWGRFVEWRRRESERLPNLEIETGLRLSAADVRASGADLVVVATGARWARRRLQRRHARARSRAPTRRCRTSSRPSRSCSDGKPVPGNARRRDRRRELPRRREPRPAAGRAGARRDDRDAVGDRSPRGATGRSKGPRLRAQLHAAGVAMLSDVSPEAIVPGAVQRAQRARRRRRSTSRPMPSCSSRSGSRNEALYLELAGRALAARLEAVYRTGDCVAPRWLVDTVFDGHRLAREIDSPDPAVYLPTLRERVVPS